MPGHLRVLKTNARGAPTLRRRRFAVLTNQTLQRKILLCKRMIEVETEITEKLARRYTMLIGGIPEG